MLIFLYGADSYRRLQKLKEITAEYQKRHSSLTVDHFDLEQEGELDRLKEFGVSQSLFGGSKFGVVHNVHAGEKEAANFLKSKLEDKDTTLIVLGEDKPTKDFAYLTKKPVLAQEFKPLKAHELEEFIDKEAQKMGMKISTALLQDLISAFGGDLWAIVTELQKITLGGKFEAQVKIPEFFSSIQTIKNHGQLKYKLSALAYLLEEEDPAKIFNITAAIASPDLKVKMADYDVAVKSGKLEYEEVLLDLVITNSA